MGKKICADCGGEVYVDVTTYNMGWRCRKCKAYGDKPDVDLVYHLPDKWKGEKTNGD